MYSGIFLFHHPKIGIGKNELFILFILKTLGNNEIGKLRPHKRHDENPWEPARVGRTKHLYNNTFAPRCGAYLSFGTYSRLFTLERCYNITAPYFFFSLFAERGAPVSLEGNNQQSFMRKGSAPKFLAFYVPFLTEQISLRILYWNGVYFACFTYMYCAYLRTGCQFAKLINDIAKLDIEHHRCRRCLYWKCFTGRWFFWKCFN